MAKIVDAGDKAPDFSLMDQAGTAVRLKNFKGQPVVLYFYPKDDTTGCTAEAIAFNGLKEKFRQAGTHILGVSPDSPASHAKFARKHKLDLELASDESKAMLQAYGVWVEKSMYGRKYMGVERTTLLIDAKGIVAHVWRKVKTPGHAEEVLKAAQAL